MRLASSRRTGTAQFFGDIVLPMGLDFVHYLAMSNLHLRGWAGLRFGRHLNVLGGVAKPATTGKIE